MNDIFIMFSNRIIRVGYHRILLLIMDDTLIIVERRFFLNFLDGKFSDD